jgi:site-specific DNA recombinase
MSLKKDGFSLSAQHRHGMNYINQNHLTLISEYSFAETASKKHLRTNFDNMVADITKLAMLTSGAVNLVVEKTDRLSRDFTSKETLQKLAKAGMLSIHYYKDNRIFDENSTPADIFNDDIQTAVAKYAAANIGRESKKGMAEKAASGIFPGRVPLGYKNKRIMNEGSRNKRGDAIIIVDPDDRCVVAAVRIFELRALGCSYELIKSKILEERILPPNKTTSFSKTGVEKILQNVFYKGEYIWNGDLYNGTHDVIIPQKYLDIVFYIGRGKHTNRPKGIFSNFLTCSSCGCSVLYDPKKKFIKSKNITTQYDYYHCSDGRREHKQAGQNQINISKEKIFVQFEDMLDKFSISEEAANQISAYLKKDHDKNSIIQKKQIAKNQQMILALEQKEEELLELLLNQTIDKSTYQKKRNTIRNEKQELVNQSNRVQANFLDGFQLKSEKILELAKSIKSLWKSRNDEERVDLLKTLLSNQTLNGKVIETTLHRPFEVLAEVRNFEELAKKKLPKKEAFLTSSNWCPREDLNLHTLRH